MPTQTLEELKAKYGPEILEKRKTILNKTESSLRDFSFTIATDDYDTLIINGIEPMLYGFILYPQKTMAMKTFGTKYRTHPDAINGYLECRKLLVERETQLVMLRLNPPGPYHVNLGSGGVLKEMNSSDLPDSCRTVISGASDKLTPIDLELEIVRVEIGEIDNILNPNLQEARA